MQTLKQGVAKAQPVILIQAADGQTPHLGATAGQVTISYRKEGATSWSSKTAVGNWVEVGKGVYLVSWSTSDLNTIGRFDAVVEHASCINAYVAYRISANLEDDIAAAIAALNDLDAAAILAAITTDTTKFAGANINATISSRSSHSAADVQALLNDLDAAAVLAAITTDDTKFAGALIANLDAAVTSRSSHAAADVVALMNDPTLAAIIAGIWTEAQSGYTTPGTFGYYLDAAISSIGGGLTAAAIAEAVHDIKLVFNKTTGGLVITMADDTPLTSVTITDTPTGVTRE